MRRYLKNNYFQFRNYLIFKVPSKKKQSKLKFQYILQNTVYKLIVLIQRSLNFYSENLSFTRLENHLKICRKNTIKINTNF